MGVKERPEGVWGYLVFLFSCTCICSLGVWAGPSPAEPGDVLVVLEVTFALLVGVLKFPACLLSLLVAPDPRTASSPHPGLSQNQTLNRRELPCTGIMGQSLC